MSKEERMVDEIVRDICEMDQDDPEHPDTICINVNTLILVLEHYILGIE